MSRLLGTVGRRGLLVGATTLPLAAQAQIWSPDRPVRMLVGFPAGGVTDVIARITGDGMAQRIGQPVIVDNRSGAAGNIAAAAVARAAPDGHTILMATNNSHGANPSLYSNLGFDPVRDFSPIALIATITNVLVVHPSVQATTVTELIALTKAQPGKFNFASASVGSAGHLVGEMFKSRTGADITHITYRGAAAAQADVMAGRVQILFGTLQTVLESVRAGHLRALAVTSLQRMPQMPDVPTMAETVLPNFSADAWFALFGPAGMSSAMVTRLNDAARSTMEDSTLRSRLTDQGFAITVSTPAELGAFVPLEVAKWGEAVQLSGARAE